MSYDDDVLRAVFELWEDGATWREIAARYGWKRGKTKHAIRAAKRLHRADTADAGDHDVTPAPASAPEPEVSHETAAGASGRLDWPTLVYGVDADPIEPVYEYTGQLRLRGDFIVVGDVHVPTTDWDFAEVMLQVAERHLPTPRKLLLAGDLLNNDAVSKFARRVPSPKLRTELRAANRFLVRMLEVFDEIYAFLGNHDAWLQFALNGELDVRTFARMVTEVAERITYSPYSDCYITSGDERWYVPHQTNYRQNKLSVADDLAARRWCNIITTHQHHSAVGRDKGNNATLIDCGGLHQPTQLAYVQLNPSTRPQPTQGFVLLRDGCATLLTPYSTMTDWAMWLGGAAMEVAA